MFVQQVIQELNNLDLKKGGTSNLNKKTATGPLELVK